MRSPFGCLVSQGKFDFGEEVWDDVSELAKDLIRKLICVDYKKRLTATEALQHPWVVGRQAEKELKGTLDNIEKGIKKKFRAKVKSVMAANRMSHLVETAHAGPNAIDTVKEEGEGDDKDEEEDEDKLLRKQVRLAPETHPPRPGLRV